MIRLIGFLAELVRGLRDVPGLLRRTSVLERQVADQRALLDEHTLSVGRRRVETKR